METLIQIAQLILCLSFLVILHELGHFIPAKYFKTLIEKFYLFFYPWFSLVKKKIGDTEYGIGWLPMGGYVKIAGMIDESMDKEQLKQEPQPWEYRSKPAWQRLIIIMGGVIVNFFLAWIIYTMLYINHGDNFVDIVIYDNGDEGIPNSPDEPIRIVLSDGKGGYDLKEIQTSEKEIPVWKKEHGDVGDVNEDGIPVGDMGDSSTKAKRKEIFMRLVDMEEELHNKVFSNQRAIQVKQGHTICDGDAGL